MKALRYHLDGGAYRLSIDDVPRPMPGVQEVRVRVAFCGICGSDLGRHRRFNAPDATLIDSIGNISPIVGHEISGTIDALGIDVPTTWPDNAPILGTPIVINPLIGCGLCSACIEKRWNSCENPQALRVIGYQVDGGFTEYVLCNIQSIVRLPSHSDLPMAVAAMAEPLAVAHHAYRQAQILENSIPVLIIGDGPIALLIAHVLKQLGQQNVTILGRHLARLEYAKSLDVDHLATNPKTIERPVPVVFQTASSQTGFEVGLSLTARGGKMICLGYLDGTDIGLNALGYNDLIRSQKKLVGSFGYSQDELEASVHDLALHHDRLKALISAIVPLSSSIELGFNNLLKADKVNMKILVQPNLDESSLF